MAEDLYRVYDVFKVYDADRSGLIGRSGFERILLALDPDTWSTDKVDALVDAADLDKDGAISFSEFLTWINVGEDAQESVCVLASEANSLMKCRHGMRCRYINDAEHCRTYYHTRLMCRNGIACTSRGDAEHCKEFEHPGDDLEDFFLSKGLLSSDDVPILEAFKKWDTSGDGLLSLQELSIVLKALNSSMCQEDIKCLLSAMDTDNDGYIDYKELLMALNGSDAAFRKAKVDFTLLKQVTGSKLCRCGCGRLPYKDFDTCCENCLFIFNKTHGRQQGHHIACEIRHNNGMAFPWYWQNIPDVEDDFHSHDECEYVRKLAENLIDVSIPGVTVHRCMRIENSTLWRKYATRRDEIRRKRVSEDANLSAEADDAFVALQGSVITCGRDPSGHKLIPCEKEPATDGPKCSVCCRPGTAFTCENAECKYDVCAACHDASGFQVGDVVKTTRRFKTLGFIGGAPGIDIQIGCEATVTRISIRGNLLMKFENVQKRYYVDTSRDAEKLELVSRLAPPKTRDMFPYSCKTTLDYGVGETWLFHGTCEAAAQGIATSSFRIPGASDDVKHGALFGHGVYLAERAAKSHVYSKPDGPDDCYVMLLCRAALGRCKAISGTDRSAQHLVREDDHFDSLVGFTSVSNSGYAREFLVYDASQVYPEYICYYKMPFPKVEDKSKAKPANDYIVHVWRTSGVLDYCVGGSGGANDGTDVDVSQYTKKEWLCYPGVVVHGGQTVQCLADVGILATLRDAGVPTAVASLKPDDAWDSANRTVMGGGGGWAVCVYSQEGASKKEFMNDPKDYVSKNDTGPP